LKKWFYGLGKEFSRITWTPLKKVWINFFIVVCVVLFFALVFYGVDFVVMNNFKK
jgi:preprotein translocase SecE subunit